MNKKEYALALSGGGTRGAYEVGAYKALLEMGVKINAIAGTSIGALNAAMFISNGIDSALDMYKNITITDVIDIDDSINTKKDIFDIENVFKLAKNYTKNKGLDNTPLKKIIKKEIDIDKIYESDIDFGLVTYSIKSRKPSQVFKEDIKRKDFVKYLLASACFPIYKAQKIDDEKYFDGFFYDNMPINMLIEKGYKNIIAIDIGSKNANKRLVDKNVYVKVVKATKDLGGVFEFNKEKMMFNIKLGYLDTMKSFNKLKGHMYYFRPYEFNRLLHKFTLEELYGLEYAADIYGIDRYEVYTCKEFLTKILEKHKIAIENYNKVRENLDFKKIIKEGRELKKIIDKGLGLCLVVDMINNKPSFRNIKLLNKLFSTYFVAADAIIELEVMENNS